MEEEKKLYPMRLVPIKEDDGSILASDLGAVETKVRNGWLAGSTIDELMEIFNDRLCGENSFNYYGRQFPVAARTIDVVGTLPVRVSPDDGTAESRYDFLGKARLWYVESAESGAKVLCGFRKDVGAEELYMACRHNEVRPLLRELPVSKGSVVRIRPNEVFSAEGRMRIVEISECSPLDFDLNESIVEVLDYVRLSPGEGETAEPWVEFTTDILDLKDVLHISSEKSDCFVLYVCVEGEASIQYPFEGRTQSCPLTVNEAVLVPAEVSDYFLLPVSRGTVLLETVVEPRKNEW